MSLAHGLLLWNLTKTEREVSEKEETGRIGISKYKIAKCITRRRIGETRII